MLGSMPESLQCRKWRCAILHFGHRFGDYLTKQSILMYLCQTETRSSKKKKKNQWCTKLSYTFWLTRRFFHDKLIIHKNTWIKLRGKELTWTKLIQGRTGLKFVCSMSLDDSVFNSLQRVKLQVFLFYFSNKK